jgi:hypothetical protein
MDDKRKKVMCPVEGKDSKTYWLRLGFASVNKDNSINVWLDALPVNGRLQIRDWDEQPWKERQQGFANITALPAPRAANDDVPF